MHNIQIPISSEPAARPMQAYLRAPAQSGKSPAIIVAHELFGVNADIHGIVDQLAAQGYVALAPEFYHRSAPAGEVLERNDEGRKRGFEYLNQITRNTIASDAEAAMNYLKQHDDVNGRIGMLGFSAGGHMAFIAAARLGITATAIVYGGWLTGGDMPMAKPEPTLTLAKDIAARGGKLLYCIGGKDAIITPAQVEQIKAGLKDAHVDAEVVVHPDALHAFFWEGTPSFNREARDDAWKRIVDFFRTNLK